MHANSHSVLMLADIRHHELQDDGAHLRLIRAASRDAPTVHAAISTACHRLGATLVHAHPHLKVLEWTLAVPRRGAFPH